MTLAYMEKIFTKYSFQGEKGGNLGVGKRRIIKKSYSLKD